LNAASVVKAKDKYRTNPIKKETKKLDYNIVEEIEAHQEKEEQEEKTES